MSKKRLKLPKGPPHECIRVYYKNVYPDGHARWGWHCYNLKGWCNLGDYDTGSPLSLPPAVKDILA